MTVNGSVGMTNGTAEFSRLLAPTVLAGLELRNHIVMPPMGTNFSVNGYVTRRGIDYYRARAAGGVALVIVEGSAIEHPRGIGIAEEQGIDDDRFLPGMSDLASVIKAEGARAFVQLHHAGREACISHLGLDPVGPSPIRSINPKLTMPRELTIGEIHDYIGRFVDGAARARRAGFDGVEVHGAHSYLLNQFLSPLCNVRTDEYGGSVERRARFVVEVVQGIKGRLGAAFPVGVRLSGEDMVEGGITIDQTCEIARLLELAGADYIHVTVSGVISAVNFTIASAVFPRGYLLGLAAKVKQAVGIPVIGVGRLNTPLVAEEALRTGKCDLVALGRALIADPEFPNKVASGRADEIRPCVACLTCIHTASIEERPLMCCTNAAAGREGEFAVHRASTPKKVVVIGGGVAGMEAARMTSLRGHRVTLIEQSDRLGGQLNAAAVPPYKGELDLLRSYYLAQMAKSGVAVRLGQAADSGSIIAEKPDLVVVATGKLVSTPRMLQVADPRVVVAEDVLLGKVRVGPRVVVVGGGSVGCETAEYLAAAGIQVTVVEMLAKMAVDEKPMIRGPLLKRLRAAGVQLLTGMRAEAIDPHGLVVSGEASSQLLPADNVVLATGARANDTLVELLAGNVPEVRVIGDAAKPRRLVEAIREGMAVGLEV